MASENVYTVDTEKGVWRIKFSFGDGPDGDGPVEFVRGIDGIRVHPDDLAFSRRQELLYRLLQLCALVNGVLILVKCLRGD